MPLEAVLHESGPSRAPCRGSSQTTAELYPEVVDACEEEGGVPSRLTKTDRREGGKGRHAMVDVRRLPVGEDNGARVTLDDLAREGALRMIAAALEAEVDDYVASFTDETGEDGKRLVVRNGRARERRVTVGSGTVPIRAAAGQRQARR